MSLALLGIDIGTSGCKALLLGVDGQILAARTALYGVSSPKPGWSEQDPEIWVNGARTAIADVLAAQPGIEILAIGLSGQMHGLTALDAKGDVLRPAILWNDQRGAEEGRAITAALGGLDGLLAETNNRMLSGYTGSKISWMRQHEPALFERLRHVLNPKDYLRYRLTGEFATEVSDASGTGLFNVRQRQWSKKVIAATGLDANCLPPCFESTEVSGHTSPLGARLFGLPVGVPVVGGGGDAVVQTLGAGVIHPNEVQSTIGTAGVLACVLAKNTKNPQGKLQVFCNVVPDSWHCMGVTLNAGGALAWLRQTIQQFAALGEAANSQISYERMLECAVKSPAGANGLIFLPYLYGERCPYPDPQARGSFIGLTNRHTESDIIRSVLEGIVFSLKDISVLMAQMGVNYNRILASGGGARSDFWRQIQADIFDCEVATTSGAAEGGALGAAFVAGLGKGVWATAQEAVSCCQTLHVQTPHLPTTRRYDSLFKIYHLLYETLSESFSALAATQLDD